MSLSNDYKLLEDINSNTDLYYISLLMLSAFKRRAYKSIPELALTLDEENLMRFLEVYGGQTIKVPTVEEFRKYIQIVSIYYYTEVKKMSAKKAYQLAGAANNKRVVVDYSTFKKHLSDIKLPNRDESND